jgi:hypothetical protein
VDGLDLIAIPFIVVIFGRAASPAALFRQHRGGRRPEQRPHRQHSDYQESQESQIPLSHFLCPPFCHCESDLMQKPSLPFYVNARKKETTNHVVLYRCITQVSTSAGFLSWKKTRRPFPDAVLGTQSDYFFLPWLATACILAWMALWSPR